MRYVMVLFKCDAEGCDAQTEELIPIRFTSYTGNGIEMPHSGLPDDWSLEPSDELVASVSEGGRREMVRRVPLKQMNYFDSSTYCPAHRAKKMSEILHKEDSP